MFKLDLTHSVIKVHQWENKNLTANLQSLCLTLEVKISWDKSSGKLDSLLLSPPLSVILNTFLQLSEDLQLKAKEKYDTP